MFSPTVTMKSTRCSTAKLVHSPWAARKSKADACSLIGGNPISTDAREYCVGVPSTDQKEPFASTFTIALLVAWRNKN